MFTRLLILVAALSANNTLIAQETYSINASVKNEEMLTVLSGEAILLSVPDRLLSGKADLSNGAFHFDNVRKGKYLLSVRSSESEDYNREIEVAGNLHLDIVLSKKIALLNEVEITGQKSAFTTKNGNLVANLSSPMFSSISDPVSLLSKIPGVLVSADGNTISVIGKGQPLIYINNQTASIDDVRSLSMSDIVSVELVNNPSSKYEASGRVVLLIKTRRNDKEGWKGELTQTSAVRKYYLNRASLNASYRKKKWEWKSSLQYNHLKTWEGNAFDFAVPANYFRSGYSVTAVTTRRPQFIAGAGVFYQLNELDYVSVNTSVRTVTEKFPIYTDSYLEEGGRSEKVTTSNFSRTPQQYITSNLNLNKAFPQAGVNIFSGFQITRLNKDLDADIFNRMNAEENRLSQLRSQSSYIDAIGGRLDAEKTFKSAWKLEAGGSYSRAASSGISQIHGVEQNTTYRETYDYKEYNGAIYTQMYRKTDKLDLSAGMRVETTDVYGNFSRDGSASQVKRNNVTLFPKASISYAPDSLHSYAVRYNKNINRPSFSNANQTVVYINPYFEWANNIDLMPSLYQEIAATLQYRKFGFDAGFYINKGSVNSNFVYDNGRGVLRRTDLNYEKESGMFFNTTIPFKIKGWSSTNTFNFIYNVITDPVAVTGKSRPFLYINSSNEFSLPGKLVLTATGWAVTKSYQGVFERNALFAIDTSLTRKIGEFTCTLRVDDMFASVNAKEKFVINGVNADGIFYDNGREFSLTVRYGFGRLKQSGFRNRDVDDNSRRVR